MNDNDTYEWEFPDGEWNVKYTAKADEEGLKIRVSWLEETIPWEWFDTVRPRVEKKLLIEESNRVIDHYRKVYDDTSKSLKSFMEGEFYYRKRAFEAEDLIELAIEIMTKEQISQWQGVRAWLEEGTAEQSVAQDAGPQPAVE